MIIAGIDFSISSPGVVVLKCDDTTLEVLDCKYKGYTDVQKTKALDVNLELYKKVSFDSDIRRFDFISNDITAFVSSFISENEEVYIGIEGYAMGATKGLVFNIAEATGMLKLKLWSLGHKIRIYDPNSIKKFATGKGNADKVVMGDFFINDNVSHKPNLTHLKDYESPKGDIVDAYWISKLLLTEIMIRHGLLSLKDLPLKTIEIFNQTSKTNKENLLVRDFICKKGN